MGKETSQRYAGSSMKARTKLILMVLVLFLVSIIVNSFFLQWHLNYQAMKLEKDPPTIFSIGVSNYLAGILAGYLVFFLLIVLHTGLIGLLVSAVLIAVWIYYFLQFYRDYLEEKRRSEAIVAESS